MNKVITLKRTNMAFSFPGRTIELKNVPPK